jgi:hypothetical protein
MKQASLLEMLLYARGLISNPDHHCIGQFALSATGERTLPRYAFKRDISAALSAASAQYGGGHLERLHSLLLPYVLRAGYRNLSEANDAGHASILALVDQAAARLAPTDSSLRLVKTTPGAYS